MKINKETTNKWKDLYTRGDLELIQASMPKKQRVTVENIRVCLREGEYSNLNVFEAIAKYYNEKAKKIKILSKIN